MSAARKMLLTLSGVAMPLSALAHGVASGDATYLKALHGASVLPLMYLGAKHMVTGYDHVLFLAGVVFFLYRLRDVALYATLFALGHSVTLLAGVLAGVHINPFLIDAIIGLSVIYKALENIGAFRRMGISIDSRAAVLLFGLAHGLGLATKLQDFNLASDGLVVNMVSFNVGVELGQLMALALIVIALNVWRKSGGFARGAYGANLFILCAGFVLLGSQITGLALS